MHADMPPRSVRHDSKLQRAAKPRRPKPKRRFPPEGMSDDEVRLLLAAIRGESMSSVRNRALVAVLYRSGLRINEALTLYPKDLDLGHGAIRVLHGKGGKSRVVGIDPGASAMLRVWLATRGGCGLNGSHPVFCTRSGLAVTAAYIRRLFPQLAAKAGILKRVHAHGFRHTHAAQLREEGVDIGIISKQLGHTSISTTARYLDHIAPWAVVKAVAARCWLSH
jgi:site-specific recombinase XerD